MNFEHTHTLITFLSTVKANVFQIGSLCICLSYYKGSQGYLTF